MASVTPKPALKEMPKTRKTTTKSTAKTTKRTTTKKTTTTKDTVVLENRVAALEQKLENFINLIEREFSTELLMGPRGLAKQISKFNKEN